MPWSVVGESVTGTAHHHRNTPCQDACRFRLFGPESGWLAVAAADGAGSASHADVGARLACEQLVARVGAREPATLPDREEVAALFGEVRAAVVAEADRLGVPARELACTALLAVVGPESAAFAQVGDGAIVHGGADGYRTAFWPEPAGYANATDFLTDERLAEVLNFQTISDGVGELAVLTDGLQRLALDFAARRPHAPFFRPLFDEVRAAADPAALVEPLRAFLDSPRVNDRTDDDKTLVIAARRP